VKEAAIQQPLLSNGFTNKHVCKATISNSNRGTVFLARSMPTCYKQDSWSNALVGGSRQPVRMSYGIRGHCWDPSPGNER
jgi:hypothetical protein